MNVVGRGKSNIIIIIMGGRRGGAGGAGGGWWGGSDSLHLSLAAAALRAAGRPSWLLETNTHCL